MTDSKPSGVRVKALVWTSHKFSVIGKGCFGAVFTISQRDNGFHVSTDSGLGVTLKTLDGAKRFYEDEYQQFVSQALEPAQPDPLGAAWMREQAADAITEVQGGEFIFGGQKFRAISLGEALEAIRAIPDPTPADLLAQAMKLPEVKALVESAKALHSDMLDRAKIERDKDGNETGRLVSAGRCAWYDFNAALAALVQP